MSFKNLCSAVALIFVSLSVTLVALPDVLYWLFSVERSPGGDFIAKRAAMLFLGLSTLCFLARHSNSPDVWRIVSGAVGTAMSALAVLGLYELMIGTAGLGILVAIVTEIVIAVLFYQVWRQADLKQ